MGTGAEIAQGSPRVGFEIWRIGRRCMTYQTPRSFLSGLKIGVAEDDRSKCKFSGAKITKGDLFLVFTMGGAKGEKPTSQVCSLRAAAAFVTNVVQSAGDKFTTQKVLGFKDLPKDLQLKATALLTTSSGKKRLASGEVATSAKRARR